jgi:hypothetical protein
MHPYYLDRVRRVVTALGIGNPIRNPYALKTKGECVTECKEPQLLSELAGLSVSCSHASRKQDWVRKDAENCGYCVPCIFRRAAMRRAGLDCGSDYGIDVLTGELAPDDTRESANDLRAVLDFLRSPITPAAMRRRILGTALIPDLHAHTALACRGFKEVQEWLESGGSQPQTTTASQTHA